MPMTDPIADMLTRIRNALGAGHENVQIPSSGVKKEIARILSEEGYVHDDLMRLTLGGFALGVAMLDGARTHLVPNDVEAA